MARQELKTLVAQGLQAAKAGSDVAKKATAEIEGDASDSELKTLLQRGNEASEQWQQRIERAISEAGGGESTNNPVVEAHYEVSRRIRQDASDALSRDLGIIAAGQLALHYWIAAFGTLRTYAQSLGLQQTGNDLQRCLEEAKEADQQHTELAERLLQGVAA